MEICKNPNDFSEKTIEEILRNHFNDSSITVKAFTPVEVISSKNDNFNSQIKNWNVTFLRGEHLEETTIVMKSSNPYPFYKWTSAVTRPFVREIFWYETAFPKLKKLCPEISSLSPVCYYGYSTYNDSFLGERKFLEKLCCIPCWPLVLPSETGLLLLKNMCSGDKPLKLLDKVQLFNYKQLKVVVEGLARFHGAWLVWKHFPDSSVGPLKQEVQKNLEMKFKPWMFRGMIKSTTKLIASLLKNQSVDEAIIERWQRYGNTRLLQKVTEFSDLKKEMTRSRLVTVCHGDAWTNNFLFNETNDEVTFLDFQMISWGHPARDLWYLFSIATDKEFRDEHLTNILKDYFAVFETYLKRCKIDPSFEEFEKEFLERRDVMFGLGTQTMPNVLSPNQVTLERFGDWKKIEEKRQIEIGSPPAPDDHPVIIEIRRRLVGMVLEAAEINFI